MWYIILFFATLLLDQITKIIVDANMALYDTIPVIDNALITFSITNHYNEGASFSFLANAEWAQTFFICLTVAVLVGAFIFLIFAKIDSKWLKATITLLISGTIGNFIDRIAFGHVRDFLDLQKIFGIEFANFNIADCCLTIGAFMLIFYVLFLDKDGLFSKKGSSAEETDQKDSDK